MKNELQIKFGQHVRELRKEPGWSQEEFADRCEPDRTYISGIERGIRNPALEVINLLAIDLSITIKDFFIPFKITLVENKINLRNTL
ncbi:helix-turn-helix domain-containing protein [Serratia ureilytica]|uniref:helix-turn-helix domain-containing protein n=1 Tax=Serratia ureilytica TaxID=300181 RepID=UPI001D18AA57|nr:helix-turn-helix transcriptional regulator [Serratia ureilytica]MCC4105371.1 helix-turn-helix transcriptional regulator [Serratia ureilytica]